MTRSSSAIKLSCVSCFLLFLLVFNRMAEARSLSASSWSCHQLDRVVSKSGLPDGFNGKSKLRVAASTDKCLFVTGMLLLLPMPLLLADKSIQMMIRKQCNTISSVQWCLIIFFTNTHTHTHTHTHTPAHPHAHACTHVHKHAHTRTRTRTRTWTHTHTLPVMQDTHTNKLLLFCPGTWRRSFFACNTF